ncbi:hypothetical protein ACFQ1E_17905 [Sphingomonas canadensis]|uniref:Uncharacterized protein n=1 Tax=Sphingomonas canadensis TaxID=1219257 RepID=A0ABW3HFZ8_9SPHN|nr:hypothetical protein [Sphingomonas canadensis]MCW3837984.1 hypothetical protein [Sphingomonas canadensis]
MSDFQLRSAITLVAAMVLVISALTVHRISLSFAVRAILGWLAVIAVIALLVSYRAEIGALFGFGGSPAAPRADPGTNFT